MGIGRRGQRNNRVSSGNSSPRLVCQLPLVHRLASCVLRVEAVMAARGFPMTHMGGWMGGGVVGVLLVVLIVVAIVKLTNK
jgi:hypothetical protein